MPPSASILLRAVPETGNVMLLFKISEKKETSQTFGLKRRFVLENFVNRTGCASFKCVVQQGPRGGYNLFLNDKYLLNSSLSFENGSCPQFPLTIKNEALAQLAALEWSLSPFIKKDISTSRPLTSLLFRAQFLDSQNCAAEEFKKILAFLPSDSILYWDSQENHALRSGQELLWCNEIKKFNSRFGVHISPSSGALTPPSGLASQNGLRDVIKAISDHVSCTLSSESIAACEMAIRDFKSCVLGLNLAFGDSTVEEAIDAATLETRIQARKWGMLKDFHDFDISRLVSRARLASVVFEMCK
ncbi:hypothetical protein MDAP_001790 [Mitosporidium daphniae]